MMGRTYWAVFSVVLILGLVGCASSGRPAQKPAPSPPAAEQSKAPAAASGEDKLQALYEKAKAEREVILWSPAAPQEMKIIIDAFTQRFPGIEVKHFQIRHNDYISRVITESSQGKVSADILAGGPFRDIQPLLERDLIDSFDYKAVYPSADASLLSDKNRVLTFYHLLRVVAYNTNLVKPDEVPKTWEELLAPKWKGKIILEGRGDTFALLGVEWGKEKAVSYLKALLDQKPIIVRGGFTVADQVIAGVAPLGIDTYAHTVIQKATWSKAPIDWAKQMSPLGADASTVLVAKGAPHINAARLFAGFLISREGQEVWANQVLNAPLYPGSPNPAMKSIEATKAKLVLESTSLIPQKNELMDEILKIMGNK